MNKNFLKIIRDTMPEPLKYLVSPLFRIKLINNKEFRRFKDLLYDREQLSQEEIKNYQLKELKGILNYANKWVPYYTNLFSKIGFKPDKMKTVEEISVIPFLTKDLIRENFNQLTSTNKVKGGNYIATTGGSTGEPLKVLLDYSSIFKTMAFIYYYRGVIGYKESHKLATFRGIEFNDKLWKYNPMYNEIILSPFKLSKITISKYLEKLNEYKPDYLNGYLSSLYFFAKLLSENTLNLKYQIKGIFLISENIDLFQRQFIEDFFRTKTLTFYGHSECCILAQETKPNEYSFDPYFGYTELINNTETSYFISGTGFLNKTMPLIRYKTDDICVFTKEGNVAILGRWDVNEYLLGINEEKVFHSAFNFHSMIFKNVTNYQFVQKQKGVVDLLLVVNKDFNNYEIDLMMKEFDKKTKSIIKFNIIITNQLILSKRGKFKKFIVDIDK